MNLSRFALAFPLILAACSSSSSTSSASDGGGTASGDVHGTVFGTAFTPTSAFAFSDANGLDLIFASTADACSDAKNGVLRASGIYVQLYSLTKQADGSWSNATDPGDVKAAQVDPACGTATKGTQSTKTVVHIDSTSGPVVGSLDLTFKDGSTFAGSFSIPICTSTLGETSTCQ